MKKGVIVILIFCTALLSGCSTAKSKTDVVSEVFSDNETVTIVSITETTDVVTEITDNIEASSADESTGEETATSDDTEDFNGITDLYEADYFAEGYADFNNLTLARRTTGDFCITDNITSLNEHYSSIKDDFEYEKIAVRTNTDLIPESLTVVAAGCELFGDYKIVNNQYLYCSGEISLSGILRHRKQNDEFGSELGRKGDVLFYPFPSDISELPMILSCGYFSPARIADEDSNFYMVSDTIELYLGNTETETVNTRINEIHNVDIPFADIYYNKEINSYLSDSEYYTATLVFSDLFLLSYQDRMSGEPYSSGNVSDIISINFYIPDDTSIAMEVD